MTDPGIGDVGSDLNKASVDQLRALAEEASTGKKSDGAKRGVDDQAGKREVDGAQEM